MDAWTITVDHIHERLTEELRRLILPVAGLALPDECTLTVAEIVAHPDAKPFRLSDKSGVLYEGFILNEIGDLPATLRGDAYPWNLICCGKPYKVDVFKNGIWQNSEYLGLGDEK